MNITRPSYNNYTPSFQSNKINQIVKTAGKVVKESDKRLAREFVHDMANAAPGLMMAHFLTGGASTVAEFIGGFMSVATCKVFDFDVLRGCQKAGKQTLKVLDKIGSNYTNYA